MIKVNLLGDETVIDHSAKIMFILFGFSLIVTCVACILMYTYSSDRLARLSADRDRLNTEIEELKKTTQEVRDLEIKKEELASKLRVMAQLKRAKPGPVRILSDLNDATPTRAWLSRIEEKNGEMVIEGVALDNETIASFMQVLEKSKYVVSVDLGETKQVDQQGAKVKSFTLQTKISYAGVFSDVLSEKDKTKVEEDAAAKN